MTSTSKLLKTVNYPNLVVLERILKGTPKLRSGMALSYESSTNQTVYYELRGFGTPPADVGRPGDVFWDITYPYIIYVRGMELWEPWNPRAAVGAQLLAEHPCFRDRYLWIGGSGSLGWFAQQSLYKADMDVRKFYSLDEAAQRSLASVLGIPAAGTTLALDVPENRARHNAEVARRQKLGISVRPTPDIYISSPRRNARPTSQAEVSTGTSTILQAQSYAVACELSQLAA
ncbi:hypothetical protein C8R47DRAFT_1170004 [Mycena vitilis]|nr:hypothetical protein C8R47DRAFT_1170004 [Mycena vitilis]